MVSASTVHAAAIRRMIPLLYAVTVLVASADSRAGTGEDATPTSVRRASVNAAVASGTHCDVEVAVGGEQIRSNRSLRCSRRAVCNPGGLRPDCHFYHADDMHE